MFGFPADVIVGSVLTQPSLAHLRTNPQQLLGTWLPDPHAWELFPGRGCPASGLSPPVGVSGPGGEGISGFVANPASMAVVILRTRGHRRGADAVRRAAM